MPIPEDFTWCWHGNLVSGVADGGTVETLTDAGPNGWHATQGNSAKRARLTTTNGIGGVPGITFDGTDDDYPFPAAALGIGNNVGALSYVAVVRRPGTSNAFRQDVEVSKGAGVTIDDRAGLYATNGGKDQLGTARLDSESTALSPSTDTNNATEMVLVARWNFTGQNARLHRNGGQQVNVTTASAGNTSATNSQWAGIGSYGGGWFSNSTYSLIAIYQRVLTDTEVSAITTTDFLPPPGVEMTEIRPVGTAASGGFTAQPSGTLHGVLADEDPGTFIRGTGV